MKCLILRVLAVLIAASAGQAIAAGADCATWGGTLLKWPAAAPVWEMCWVRPSQSVASDGSGLELRDVHYKGILVAKRLHAPILFAEYRGSSTCYRDWKDANANFAATPPVRNQLGVPGTFIATTTCDVSNAATASYQNCPWNTLPGSTFTSADCIGGAGGVAIEDMGDHVVLTTQYSASWYQYTSRYAFWENGDIQPEFGFGNSNGTNNNLTHWHHNYWRFDFDIDGSDNNEIRANGVPQSTEFTGLRSLTGGPGGGVTYWDVVTTKGGFGYRIVSGNGDYTPANESGRNFHTVDVIGSRFINNEYADRANNNLGDCEMQAGNIANGQSIADTDVVFWYRTSVRDANGNNWPPNCSGASCEPQNSMVCKSGGPTMTRIGDWPIYRNGFE
ncbi:MAG TPA: hypothetical protein PKO41_07990 [Dokdonella sp.]|uniref:hypothetical protein n=1 Tax=Dokdonella sp. TaxID=2291710 RepID=UPI0025B89502|nr:hypothetical protein [Dokdonella sp.]MBX3692932.1 hypothetical protein [Dokdonella sp.]MCW5568851.1 hypothetical protein [Dokdonella sp.]HNR92350.1 hypothetical protein [Dokdonella sp.]